MVQATIANAYPKIPRLKGEKNLRNALNRYEKGKIDARELEETFVETITRVINYQFEAGMDIVTDGMIRWDDPLIRFTDGVRNLERGGLLRYFDNNIYYRRSIISGELGFEKPSTVNDFKLASKTCDRPVRAILPGPYTFSGMVEDNYYFNSEKLITSLTEILMQEVRSLKEAGCRIIQLEEPLLLYHPDDLDYASSWFNRITEISDIEFWLCFYFGEFAKIADRIDAFNADVIAVDVASHPNDFEALLNLNSDKRICFGLLDSRDIRMEKEEEVLSRMRSIRQSHKGKDFYISTSASLEFLPPDEAYDKLFLLGRLKSRFDAEEGDA